MKYVLRVLQKGAMDWSYVNKSVIHSKKDIDKSSLYRIELFMMSRAEAKKLMMELIMNRPDIDLAAVALVEMSNYEPFREFEVKFYKEFK